MADVIGVLPDGLAVRYASEGDDLHLDAEYRTAAILLSTAERFLQEERPVAAERAAVDAFQRFKERGDCQAVSDSLRVIILARRTKAQALPRARRRRTRNQAAIADATLASAEGLARGELGLSQSGGDLRGTACMKLALAELATDRKRFQLRRDAAWLAEEAQTLYRRSGDRRGEALSLCVRAHIGLERRKLKDAERFAEASIQILGTLGGRFDEERITHARALFLKAAALHDQEHFAAAVLVIKEAEAMARDIGHKRLLAGCLFLASHCYWRKGGRPREAALAAAEAASSFFDLGCGGGWAECAESVLVKTQQQEGSTTKAIEVAKDNIRRRRYTRDLGARLLAREAGMQALQDRNDKGDLDKALVMAQKSLAAARSSGLQLWELRVLQAIGAIHLRRRSAQKATDAAEEAIKFAEKLRILPLEAETRRMLLNVFFSCDSLSRACEIAREQRRLLNEADETSLLARAFLQAAKLLSFREDWREGLRMAQDAHQTFKDAGEELGAADALLMQAKLQNQKKDFETALTLGRQAQENYRTAGEARLVGKAAQTLCDIFQSMDDPEKATKVASEAVAFARKAGDKWAEVRMNSLLAKMQAQILYREANAPGADPNKVLGKNAARVMQPAKEAVILARKINDKMLIGNTLNSMADVQLTIGRADAALNAAGEAVTLFQKVGDKKGEAKAVIISVDAHHVKKEKALAIHAGERAVVLAREANDWGAEQHAIQVLRRAGGVEPPAFLSKGQKSRCGSAVGQLILKLLKQVGGKKLKIDPELDTPMHELGFDSFQATAINNQLSRDLALPLPQKLVLLYSTPREMVDYVEHLLKEDGQYHRL